MTEISLTSTTGSGYLESDGEQIKDLLQDGGVEPTSSSPLVTKTGTQTLTNKAVTPRVTSITSHATPTINTDNCDIVDITALAEAITSMTTNLTGTINNGQKVIFRIKDDGTARAITWGAKFVARGQTPPTTTVLGKIMYVGFIGNSTANIWDCVAISQEA